jgi:hypothetical protein
MSAERAMRYFRRWARYQYRSDVANGAPPRRRFYRGYLRAEWKASWHARKAPREYPKKFVGPRDLWDS